MNCRVGGKEGRLTVKLIQQLIPSEEEVCVLAANHNDSFMAKFAIGATVIGLGIALYLGFANSTLGWIGLFLSFMGLSYWVWELLSTECVTRSVPEAMIRALATIIISAGVTGYGWPRLAYSPLPDLNPHFPAPGLPAQPQISPPPQPPRPLLPRNYLVIDGSLQFQKLEAVWPNGNREPVPYGLYVGGRISFNFYPEVVGTEPISAVGLARKMYLEKDFSDATQKRVIDDFRELIKRSSREYPDLKRPRTEMPGESGFASIEARDESDKPIILTQSFLDDIHAGRTIIFALIEMAYLDHTKLHHYRKCTFLQAPALPPGTWHDCEEFNDSD